jgi:diguanylate cyclase (GGDEF)-like protein
MLRQLHRGYAGSLSLGVLLGGLALTAVVYRVSENLIAHEASLRFDNDTRDVEQRIATRVRLYSDVLVTMQALFSVGDQVSRGEFRDFVNGLNLPDRYPGFQTLNYAQFVSNAGLLKFVAMQHSDPLLRQAGIAFVVRPAGARSAHYILSYVEPLAPNLPSLGLDLGQESRRLDALERSRDSGEPMSSGRLIMAEGRSPHVGIALRLPVYRKGMPHDTVEARRRAYIGSVGAGIRVSGLMAGLLTDDALRVLRFRIYDAGRLDEPVVPPSSSTLLFDSVAGVVPYDAGADMGAGGTVPVAVLPSEWSGEALEMPAAASRLLTSSVVQPFGGRRWLIAFAADPTVLGGTQRYLPQLAALAGTLISALMAGLAWALSTSRVRAVALARRITYTLRESERARAEAQRIAHLGDWQVSADGRTVQLSNEMARLTGWPGGASTPDALMTTLQPPERAKLVALAKRTLRTGTPFQFECRYRSRRGRRGWLHLIGHAYGPPEARALRGTALEVTERRLAMRAQQLEHAFTLQLATATSESGVFQLLVDMLVDGMEWDAGVFWPSDAGRQQAVHAASCVRAPELVGWLQSREGGLTIADAQATPCWIAGGKALGRLAHGPWLATAGISTVFAFAIHAGANRLGVAEFYARERRHREPHGLAMARSITVQLGHFLLRCRAEDELRFIATHDALTGLPNRLMFRDRLEEAVLRARREQTTLHVLFIDLDQFKDVNDSLGHNAGDALLRAVAVRLQRLGSATMIARLGGDEFTVLVEARGGDQTDITDVVMEIQAALREPFHVGDRPLQVTASIGISAFPEDGDDAQTLLKHADLAMYGAKGEGKNTYQLYAHQMGTSLQRRLEMEVHLRHAVSNGEFVLFYQPRICLRSGRCTGVEALIRWRHPTLGLVPPMEFIPLAEETGAIVEIGAWVLHEASRQNAEWLARGLGPVRVGVNLSARQFADKDLHREIVAALTDTGLPGDLLELELTESMVMRHAEQAAAWLASLKRTGVRLAIDDFGTGYSSLAYLNRFPIDVVKIDRSFIRDVPGSESDAQLASAVIALGHSLGLEVVAEGVETEAHVDFLRQEGCDEVQGYFYSRPVPAGEMAVLLDRWRTRGPAECGGRNPCAPGDRTSRAHPTRERSFNHATENSTGSGHVEGH